MPYDPALAAQLLDDSATRIATATAFASCRTASRSTLQMGSATSGRDRARDELWKKCLAKIGIRIDFIVQKWPDLLKMGRAGKLQMWPVGWITQYDEGDAFMQLLYTKNIGQSNYSRFALPEYDELYRKTKKIPAGPERTALYRKMTDIVERAEPVGPRRLADREHAGAAVGRRLQEARVPRARRGSTTTSTSRSRRRRSKRRRPRAGDATPASSPRRRVDPASFRER